MIIHMLTPAATAYREAKFPSGDPRSLSKGQRKHLRGRPNPSTRRVITGCSRVCTWRHSRFMDLCDMPDLN
jgi:hypothetical protein